MTTNYPDVNVLINNAGIQLRYNVLKADARDNWYDYSKEITTNIEAPVHLSMLFAPYFAKKETAAIINVTSGLAFTPFAIAPVYSATKAALHSYTMSLRHQLSATSVEVIEIAPPAVNTDLGSSGLHTHWGTAGCLHGRHFSRFSRRQAGNRVRFLDRTPADVPRRYRQIYRTAVPSQQRLY